jgi:hypothetical protein
VGAIVTCSINVDPFGNLAVSALVAAIPILFLFIALAVIINFFDGNLFRQYNYKSFPTSKKPTLERARDRKLRVSHSADCGPTARDGRAAEAMGLRFGSISTCLFCGQE